MSRLHLHLQSATADWFAAQGAHPLGALLQLLGIDPALMMWCYYVALTKIDKDGPRCKAAESWVNASKSHQSRMLEHYNEWLRPTLAEAFLGSPDASIEEHGEQFVAAIAQTLRECPLYKDLPWPEIASVPIAGDDRSERNRAR